MGPRQSVRFYISLRHIIPKLNLKLRFSSQKREQDNYLSHVFGIDQNRLNFTRELLGVPKIPLRYSSPIPSEGFKAIQIFILVSYNFAKKRIAGFCKIERSNIAPNRSF